MDTVTLRTKKFEHRVGEFTLSLALNSTDINRVLDQLSQAIKFPQVVTIVGIGAYWTDHSWRKHFLSFRSSDTAFFDRLADDPKWVDEIARLMPTTLVVTVQKADRRDWFFSNCDGERPIIDPTIRTKPGEIAYHWPPVVFVDYHRGYLDSASGI